MAEVCNGGRSRLCSVLLSFSEKSLNGACRRPSERGQFLGYFLLTKKYQWPAFRLGILF